MIYRKISLGLVLVFLMSACSILKLSKDKESTYFTVEEYKQTFDEELHSKKEFEESVRIELKHLNYLELESLERLVFKKDFYKKSTFLLTKSYKNIREIENDKKYMADYLKEDGKSIQFFVYKNNKALVLSYGGDKTCAWNNLDLLELKDNNLTVRSFGGTSYHLSPITVFEEKVQ